MTIHSALIPSLRNIWQVVFNRLTGGSMWFGKIPGRAVTFYSRGTFALRSAVEMIMMRRKQEGGCVWLPDYLCREPADFLISQNWRLYFYPIKKDLTLDWERLSAAAEKANRPTIFVLVHYFGFPGQREKAEKFCQRYEAVLLEDCAHQIEPDAGARNPMVFSPRKIFPIPDGGVLLTPWPVEPLNGQHHFFSVGRWLCVRLAQKIMLLLRIPWHRWRAPSGAVQLTPARPSIANQPRTISRFSLVLLNILEKDLPWIIQRRRQNYLAILQAVTKIQVVTALFPDLPDNVCPYVFPLVVPDGQASLINKLQKRGIPALRWPALPDDVLNHAAEHSDACWLREHIVLLPIHQDLGNRQIQYIIDCLNKAI